MLKLLKFDLELDPTGIKGKELVEKYNGRKVIVYLDHRGRSLRDPISYHFCYDSLNEKIILRIKAPQEKMERAKELVRFSAVTHKYIDNII